MAPLTGRHAVITGAGRGIGAAIAERLAADGATITLMGRTRETLDTHARRLSGHARVHAVVCDVTQPDVVAAAFDEARGALGPVAILVNNAGQAGSAPVRSLTLDDWQLMIDINLTGTFLCTRAALPDMLAAGAGRIVNIASAAGLRGYPYVAAYVAAKHGVIGFTRSLALEVATNGITVNAVCPGYTETDMVRENAERVAARTGRSVADVRAAFVSGNPQRRFIAPDEVADTVAWLCADGSSAITGQSIAVAGGEVM